MMLITGGVVSEVAPLEDELLDEELLELELLEEELLELELEDMLLFSSWLPPQALSEKMKNNKTGATRCFPVLKHSIT